MEMMENSDKTVENLEKFDESILNLKDAYEVLVKIYKRYIHMDEKYYPIVALWILGSFFHKCFPSYPFLFVNASKQSGKTRFLKLSSFIVNGTYTVSLTEAVLFRENVPIFIDEIENITKKEKSGLRELLNVAYKKGGVVKRVKINKETGRSVVESFELYRPVAMANISGMDDVLEDRCIVINLERCFDPVITRRLELFELDEDIKKIKEFMLKSVVSDDVVVGEIYRGIQENIATTLKELFDFFNKTTLNNITSSLNNNNTNITKSPYSSIIIDYVNGTELEGRDLEIFLPLFIIASKIGEEVLKEAVGFACEYAKKRKESNVVENRDYIAVGFLAGYIKAMDLSATDYVALSDIVRKFKILNPEEEWFNSKWLGHFLKRTEKIIIERRRTGKGREVVFNVNELFEKAKKLGVDYEKISENISEIEEQTTLKPAPDWIDRQKSFVEEEY